jgi:gamma-glutamyltranspeptidase
MMGVQAFTKTGNTVAFVATTSAPAAVQCVSTTIGGNQYRIINSGTATVFLGYGSSASDATNAAVVITSTGTAFPLLAGTDEILTFVPNAYFTGITATGNATIYVTPGDGV